MINAEQKKKMMASGFEKVICDLANIAEDWNDAQEEPGERGRGNGAIGLIIFEDGSGFVADFEQSPDNNPIGNGFVIHRFNNPKGARDWFIANISGRSLYGDTE